MAIHYVSSLATGGGTGAFVDPWTLQEGADGTLGGDECRIMADGVYLPTATTNFDVVVGSPSEYPVFVGANDSGDVDGTKPEISGENTPANSDIFLLGIASQRALFKNIIIRNAKRHGINSNGGLSMITVFNSEFYDCVTTGFFTIFSSSRFFVKKCTFTDCGLGLGSPNTLRFQNSIVLGCCFNHNTTGLQVGADVTVLKNLFKRNSFGFTSNGGANQRIRLLNNVFFGNTSDGAFFPDTADVEHMVVSDNIFRSNGGYGINTSGSDIPIWFLSNNCFSNNTSGNVDINSGVVWGDDNILEDPLFVSETLDEEDFNLQSNSPCIGAGLNPVGY